MGRDAVIPDRRSGNPAPRRQAFSKRAKGSEKERWMRLLSGSLLVAPFCSLFGEIRWPLLLFAPYCSPTEIYDMPVKPWN
jgi:hypothetical protein